MKVICLAEKPSQAKEITMKLSGGDYRTSRSGAEYIQNYEFQFHYQNQPCDFVMTSLLGHVLELDFESEYRKWYACNPSELFRLPVLKTIPEDKKKIVKNLENLVRYANVLMIWTDCDREGENIGMEGVVIAKKVKPSIVIKRARFSVMLNRELMMACQNAGNIDQRLVDAVDARSEIDLRIGAALTRFQTLLLQKTFNQLANQVISYGSCQFPTLGFIVDRYLKIQNFIPEDYSKIEMTYIKDDIEVKFNWKRGMLFDQQLCFIIYEKCMSNPIAKVMSFITKPSSKWRPLPLTTVELQKSGSKYLKMTSDKIMEIANQLYNKGFISYPRTETDIFDKKMDLKPLIEKQLNDPEFNSYANKLLNGAFLWPRSGKINDMSHPPIHPTAAALNLTHEERQVYEFVVRRFLAVCSNDAKGQQTIVEVELEEELFNAKGLVVHELNYLEIYKYEKWNDKTLPKFELNEQFIPTTLEMVDGVTSPPKLLSEAELITVMSKNGIGTDATIHEHIKKVLDRKYVFKQNPGQVFCPYELGVGLVEGYDKIGLEKSLSKPFLRRELENYLKGICEGTQTKNNVLKESLDMYFDVFNTTINNSNLLIGTIGTYLHTEVDLNASLSALIFPPSSEPVLNCNLCGLPMKIKQISNGSHILGCAGYPNCRHCMWFNKDTISKVETLLEPCPSCNNQGKNVKLLKFTFVSNSVISQLGQCYQGCIMCDDNIVQGLNLRFNVPTSSTVQPTTVASRNTNTTRNSNVNNSSNLRRNNSVPNPPLSNNIRPDTFNTQPTGNLNLNNSNNTSTSSNQNVANNSNYNNSLGQYSNNNMEQFRQLLYTEINNNIPRCRCNLISELKEVFKDGPNKGRKFYKCISASGTCNFFQWADEVNNQGSTTNQVASGSNVVCYKCGQPGHFAPNCTNTTNHISTSSVASSSNSNNLTCFKCNQPGHIAPNCPSTTSQVSTSNLDGITCFKCNQPGHYATTCTQNDSSNSRGRGRGTSRRATRRGRGRGRGKRG